MEKKENLMPRMQSRKKKRIVELERDSVSHKEKSTAR